MILCNLLEEGGLEQISPKEEIPSKSFYDSINVIQVANKQANKQQKNRLLIWRYFRITCT